MRVWSRHDNIYSCFPCTFFLQRSASRLSMIGCEYIRIDDIPGTVHIVNVLQGILRVSKKIVFNGDASKSNKVNLFIEYET